MRVVAFTLLLGLAVTAMARQSAEPKAKSDPELVQGKWVIIGLDSGGKAERLDNYKGSTFAFEKDKAILKEAGHEPIEFNFSLDASKSPKTFDLVLKGNTLRGIYKFDNDNLVLCISIGGPRPTEFITKAGGDCEIFTMRRSLWEKYTDKTFGFTVELPGKVEERQRKVETAAGPVPCSLRMVKGDADHLSCLVSIVPLTMKKEGKELEKLMEAVRKIMLVELAGSANSTYESDKEFQTTWYAGREWSMEVEVPTLKDKGLAKVRMFLAEDHLYGLLVLGAEEPMRLRAARVWDSFRLPSMK
jgi:uncharacterized protein (TIGR03067 family)